MSARRSLGQMATALRAAGVRVSVCPIHHAVKPCGHCDRAFDGAERQRAHQFMAEAKMRHAEWLAKVRQ